MGVFGRIGAGKSSLVNALLGDDVLPTGARPVTAIPTRVSGGEPAATVLLHEDVATIGLAELAAWVTEEGNPGNRRGVVSVEVSHPAVPEGLRFLDTPGVGSLGSEAAARTFAWLPRCDLGLLLIAGGGSIERDDLALASGLARAGIALRVLLSKADLLSDEASDRERALRHVAETLARVSDDASPEIHPVSARPGGVGDLERFRQAVLAPLAADHRRRRHDALAARLGELVRATERAVAARREGGAPAAEPDVSEETVVASDRARRDAWRSLNELTDCLAGSEDTAIERAAGAVVSAWGSGEDAAGAARAAFLSHAGDTLEDVGRLGETIGAAAVAEVGTRLPPVFDPEWLDDLPDLAPPRLASVVPLRRARHRLAPLRPGLRHSLSRYAVRLHHWGEALIGEAVPGAGGGGIPSAERAGSAASTSRGTETPPQDLNELLERLRTLEQMGPPGIELGTLGL